MQEDNASDWVCYLLGNFFFHITGSCVLLRTVNLLILVHGHLRSTRILLPACTYHSTGSTFGVEKEYFTGFK